ncbi:hypothetical protein COU53_00630, partial [Candidatus Pacearchaeota archaeon CG10_big_fil_rev_8_21_14_0_10_30_48]
FIILFCLKYMITSIIKVYHTREEISEIVKEIENYSFEDLRKHDHFEFSVMEKSTDIELLEKTFGEFELIKSIELRENEKGQKHYGFNYELRDGTFVVIVLVLDSMIPMIVNGYHRNMNYKRFERSLRKYYGDKFI